MNFEQMIGFGVAGNFAGHLEQAGEAADFTQVKTENAIQPKAIFPFYVPSEKAGFLSTFPLSHNQINFPQGADNLQIEPEIALICDLIYKAFCLFYISFFSGMSAEYFGYIACY